MSASRPKTVLVTGANGYIGNAVARAFVRAGWTTYGLVRNPQTQRRLAADEIIPLLGSPSDHSFLEGLYQQTKTFDVIVSNTEDFTDYTAHFNDIVGLLRILAAESNANGVRPLVIFSSGCKDYGMTALDGASDLAPHTETSPLNPPAILKVRTISAVKMFEHADLFDATITRPTTVYGLSSSFYGTLFEHAAVASGQGVIEFQASPKSIMHGMHVDDCGEAYVALAEHPDRAAVNGECFNISGWKYETLEEVANALVKEFGIAEGVKYSLPQEGANIPFPSMVAGFSQWVGSDKIRKLTGWKDRRPLFTQGLHTYRVAYEAAVAMGHDNVKRVQHSIEVLTEKDIGDSN